MNSPSGKSDLETSIAAMKDELPACRSTSLIVSWFGSDLRCGNCDVKPKLEKRSFDGGNMPWSVSDVTRATGEEIAQQDGRPIYGGTPADASVVESIRHMRGQGLDVMFYPFILMDQQAGNGLEDPWGGAIDTTCIAMEGAHHIIGGTGP